MLQTALVFIAHLMMTGDALGSPIAHQFAQHA
jgi:hypothetical protein